MSANLLRALVSAAANCLVAAAAWPQQPLDLDPSFRTHINWGSIFALHPLPDGRCYAAGYFRVDGSPDTLRLVRFLPNGLIDPTFDAHLSFTTVHLTSYMVGVPSFIHRMASGDLIVTGAFEKVGTKVRRGICLLDSTGLLLDHRFDSAGVGTFIHMGLVQGSIRGITEAPDGSYYIWGSYHGYNDGTTHDTWQRMMSRLHGLNVAVPTQPAAPAAALRVYPNPASGPVTVHWQAPAAAGTLELVLHDIAGRPLLRHQVAGPQGQHQADPRGLRPGTYLVALLADGRRLG